ncbi:hypothetical protein BGZ50_001747, partial [Haplosporangium sp. Z 11]
MGVPGWWTFVHKKGYTAETYHNPPQPSPQSKLRVDVNSTFYSTIVVAYSRNDQTVAHQILESRIARLGDKTSLVL